MSAIITLTTDFGLGSPYVAAMKGVILSINPEARLVDLSHAVGPQNVRQGALVLAEATTWFPAGTIHVGVVDPGVGTQRRIVYARIGDQQYIAPDNGLLSRLTLKTRPSQIITVENPEHWLPSVSNTFHGRDIMAPVAAQLSLGMEPDRLGPPLAALVELDWPQPRIESNAIVGEVVWIDGFGNLISNVTEGMLTAIQDRTRATVGIEGHTLRGIDRTYGDRPANTPLALVGSSGYLEVSAAGGSAAATLRCESGARVTVRW
jgi:S-adenosylmethionine hydrolase